MAKKRVSDLKHEKIHYFWAGLRVLMGLIFLWAFFDKLLGLGFSTCFDSTTRITTYMCDKAWINGGSPTLGFLKFATHGPFSAFYQSLAGSSVIDWLFMLGLLGIGLTLTLGFLVRIGSLSGALLLSLMWAAAIPPQNNPIIDEHIIYIVLMFGFAFIHTCKHWGLGRWWSKFEFVKKHKILE